MPSCSFCKCHGHNVQTCADKFALIKRLCSDNLSDDQIKWSVEQLNDDKLIAVYKKMLNCNVSVSAIKSIYSLHDLEEKVIAEAIHKTRENERLRQERLRNRRVYNSIPSPPADWPELGDWPETNSISGGSLFAFANTRVKSNNQHLSLIISCQAPTNSEDFQCCICQDTKSNMERVNFCTCQGFQCYICFVEFLEHAIKKKSILKCPCCRKKFQKNITTRIENPVIIDILQPFVQ
jgi:hypothetical protein